MASLYPESDLMPDNPRLCLAASGGGHVRQLLDLKPFWREYDHFFVTEDTALGRSIAGSENVEFVPHFALGQARLGAPWRMLSAALRSAVTSWRIIWRRRPDYVITTGAGSQVFVLLWSRLIGARIILIDSFARFDGPSAFARLAGPLAHVRISQSEAAAHKWGRAELYNPLRLLAGPIPVKDRLVFATVGATLAFPRLAQLVLAAKRSGVLPGEVILQAGDGAADLAMVEGVKVVKELPFDEIRALLARASIVICHGGTGSIVTALQNYCHVIVIPRRHELGEHYDDHQTEITSSFQQRGLVRIADDETSLGKAIDELNGKSPVGATTDPQALIGRLRELVPKGPL